MRKKINEKHAAIAVCVLGTLLAIFTQSGSFESFLYFIGSVFAPMIAVQITDYYILKNDGSEDKFNIINLAVWVVGFILYRLSMSIDFILGNTFPVMIITGILCFAANKLARK